MSSPKSQKSRSLTKSPPGPQSPAALGQVAEEQAAIEVDDDSDSSYSKSTGITDTESLRSSIMAFKWENGRRYHAYQDGSYWAPNDDRQQEAEDLMHEVYRIILGNSLYEAPIGDNPQKVLDIGCGTGIWAIEFADEHPSADVLGVDLSPIQPNFVPPNCRFEVDDITNEWTYPEDTFDFIHARSMIGCLPDWTDFYRKAFKHTKPGGWVESVELWGNSKCDDDTLKPESPLHKWVEVFKKIESLTGKSFFWDEKMQDSISDAGFINVSGRRIKVPIGTWPKDKNLKQWGAWNRHFLLQGLEGFSIRGLTEMLGWKYEDAQLFLADMRKELTNPALHAYLDVVIAWIENLPQICPRKLLPDIDTPASAVDKHKRNNPAQVQERSRRSSSSPILSIDADGSETLTRKRQQLDALADLEQTTWSHYETLDDHLNAPPSHTSANASSRTRSTSSLKRQCMELRIDEGGLETKALTVDALEALPNPEAASLLRTMRHISNCKGILPQDLRDRILQSHNIKQDDLDDWNLAFKDSNTFAHLPGRIPSHQLERSNWSATGLRTALSPAMKKLAGTTRSAYVCYGQYSGTRRRNQENSSTLLPGKEPHSYASRLHKHWSPRSTGSNMVGFRVYAYSTKQNTKTVKPSEDFCCTIPTRSVNHIDFQTHPIVLSIETKAGSNSDAAELQIGSWHAAQWAFLKLAILRAQDAACSTEQQMEQVDQALSRLRTLSSSHKQLPQTISTTKMSVAVQTQSMTVHFKLKKGKKQPKRVLLQALEEHYGKQQVECHHDEKKKELAIKVTKNCDTAEQMKDELWPVLEKTEVFKTWEAERIMVLHADTHCTYLLG
ncbi:methyltransferase [Fusarium pseudocircinatum]|uniref:Methyltransferase n=1 Tax=Fusarium pseudocircinatum TaxID=56676 RepID=A0A8H5P321_9HYPO|nr:methyltransferase [Fusarium pseudocircinatum]